MKGSLSHKEGIYKNSRNNLGNMLNLPSIKPLSQHTKSHESSSYVSKGSLKLHKYSHSMHTKPTQESSSITRSIQPLQLEDTILRKHNFNFLFPVGRGGFGKVWKGEEIKTKTVYAIKEMSKAK